VFDAIAARGGAAAAVSDEAWLQAMLDAEAALARALARAGLIEEAEAEAIAAACRAERFDAAAIAAGAAGAGNPVVPLKAALTDAVEGAAARQVHRGATSQDILDTAAMLVTARALAPLLDDVATAAHAAARLARAHRDTPMAGRTLLQQAVPVTFGLKAAGWLAGLDDARRWLEEIRLERLAAQLGGAAGTLASLGDAGPAVVAAYAELLELAEPVTPWHAQRGRVGELASALAVLSGAVAKAAGDIVLLSQTEVGEVREARGGGSSAMPHKRNPIAAICAVACAQQAPGLAATLLGAMAHEHERAAGSWHAEWRPLGELLRSTGSAVAWLRESLEGLEVDPERMCANLDLTGGRLMAERVAAALGGVDAHERVAEAARGEDFPAAVAELVGAERAAELLDPTGYLGAAGLFVDRALDDHDREA
jgi:3-carboxy-cis,cis-muconate cycloisomerase